MGQLQLKKQPVKKPKNAEPKDPNGQYIYTYFTNINKIAFVSGNGGKYIISDDLTINQLLVKYMTEMQKNGQIDKILRRLQREGDVNPKVFEDMSDEGQLLSCTVF